MLIDDIRKKLLAERQEDSSPPDLVCYEITSIAEMYEGHAFPEKVFRSLAATVPIQLPYPRTWIEGRFPVEGGGKTGVGVDLFETGEDDFLPDLTMFPHSDYYAAYNKLVKEGLRERHSEVAHFIFGSVALEVHGKFGTFVSAIDKNRLGISAIEYDGGIAAAYVADRDAIKRGAKNENIDEAMIDIMAYVRRRILFALLMMRVKNVMVDDHKINAKMQQARLRRHRPPFVDYKTLRIVAPGQARREREGTSGPSQGIIAAHLVGGHPITFTEERPAFGKPWGVGTFFVPAHARGNKEKGVILKDYEVVDGEKLPALKRK